MHTRCAENGQAGSNGVGETSRTEEINLFRECLVWLSLFKEAKDLKRSGQRDPEGGKERKVSVDGYGGS